MSIERIPKVSADLYVRFNMEAQLIGLYKRRMILTIPTGNLFALSHFQYKLMAAEYEAWHYLWDKLLTQHEETKTELFKWRQHPYLNV